MSDRNGWIKIHRKLLDNPVVCKDPDHLAVWMYLLLEAAHKDHETLFGGKPIVLAPGQLITGRQKISRETKVEQHKADRIIKLFKSAQLIEQRAECYGSLISILNWDKYQNDEQQNEQRVSNERATSEQRVSTIQEYKNDKNDKKYIYKDVPEEIKEPFMEWVAMRKTLKKPITTKSAVTRALNKLYSLSKNPDRQRELIEYATYKNWLSFYPIPQDDKIPKKTEEPKPKPIEAVAMPDDVRNNMSALGFGNLIGGNE